VDVLWCQGVQNIVLWAAVNFRPR